MKFNLQLNAPVEISFALRKEVEVARIEPIDSQCCIYVDRQGWSKT